MHSLPRYYSELGPFREVFLGGGAVLTYHHVGPRPRGVRLKGLYVSPQLFAKQIRELAANEFAVEKYSNVTHPSDPKRRRCFVTFDDGFRDVFTHGLPVLRQNGFPAIQFLVAALLGQTSRWQEPSGEIPGQLMDEAEIKEWIAAGNEIGSHTSNHPFLTRIPAAEAREEITASKKKLEDKFGLPVNHFCYPYGDYNQTVRDLVEQAGYTTACTTAFGVNDPGADPFTLKRVTARYPSRNWKNFKGWLAAKFFKSI